MPTTNVACPYCGGEARATLPRDKLVNWVSKSNTTGNWSKTACPDCGKTFHTHYKDKD